MESDDLGLLIRVENSILLTCPLREENSFSQRAFSICGNVWSDGVDLHCGNYYNELDILSIS